VSLNLPAVAEPQAGQQGAQCCRDRSPLIITRQFRPFARGGEFTLGRFRPGENVIRSALITPVGFNWADRFTILKSDGDFALPLRGFTAVAFIRHGVE
jgi:hypothetical protein